MSFAANLPHRLFTREDVLRMLDAGVIGEDEPLELLEGELIQVAPQGPAHANLAALIGSRLARSYPEGFMVRPAAPLDAGEANLPEPDVAVFRGTERSFGERHPRGDEAVLVIEIARTSHAIDRIKAAIYARAGVPVYWIIDLPAKRIEVHEQPQPDGRYRMVRVLAGSDAVPLPNIDLAWTVSELLP